MSYFNGEESTLTILAFDLQEARFNNTFSFPVIQKISRLEDKLKSLSDELTKASKFIEGDIGEEEFLR